MIYYYYRYMPSYTDLRVQHSDTKLGEGVRPRYFFMDACSGQLSRIVWDDTGAIRSGILRGEP